MNLYFHVFILQLISSMNDNNSVFLVELLNIHVNAQ